MIHAGVFFLIISLLCIVFFIFLKKVSDKILYTKRELTASLKCQAKAGG
jgi:hypothetical protein